MQISLVALLLGIVAATVAVLVQWGRNRDGGLVWFNGVGYTCTGPLGHCELKKFSAFAVQNGRVVAVGEDNDIRNRYSQWKHNDLQQHTVLPGLMDAHAVR